MSPRRFDDINPETNKLPVDMRRRFVVSGVAFDIEFTLPIAIKAKVTDSDWDRIMDRTKARAKEYVQAWRSHGSPADMKAAIDAHVGRFLAEQIYTVFREYQLDAGNEAWEVPQDLQKHTLQ